MNASSGFGVINKRRWWWFLGVFLLIWTVIALILFIELFLGEVELWGLVAFSVSWIVVAAWFVLSAFGTKTVTLRSDHLEINAGLWGLSFSETIPKNSIRLIKQVQDGGARGDSFPSWGVRIKSNSIPETRLQKIVRFNHFGNDCRMRTILLRHPYEHALLLAVIIGKWSEIDPVICEPPMD